jgi:hypothetical protein
MLKTKKKTAFTQSFFVSILYCYQIAFSFGSHYIFLPILIIKLIFVLTENCVSDCNGNPFLLRPFGEAKKIEMKGAPAFFGGKAQKFINLMANIFELRYSDFST